MRIKSILIAVLATNLVASANAAEQMRPGKWEVSQTMEVGGTTLPAQTHAFCLRENEMQDAQGTKYMMGGEMPDNCQFDKMEFEGNTASWAVTCTGEDAMQGSGETTMYGDRYEGVMRMRSADGEMTTHMKGQRVGDC